MTERWVDVGSDAALEEPGEAPGELTILRLDEPVAPTQRATPAKARSMPQGKAEMKLKMVAAHTGDCAGKPA